MSCCVDCVSIVCRLLNRNYLIINGSVNNAYFFSSRIQEKIYIHFLSLSLYREKLSTGRHFRHCCFTFAIN